MKIVKSVLLLSLSLLALFGCATTDKSFVSGLALDPSLTMAEKFEAFGGIPVKVDLPEIYFDGHEWLEEMTRLVDEAEDYVLLSTFLGSFSDNLQEFYNTLIKKAEEGVRIYFIMDGASSYDMTETKDFLSPIYYLRDYGINLLEYAPFSGFRAINIMSIFRREHRKIFVVDGKVCAIGGMNLNYISVGAAKGETQRDSMFVFHSPELTEVLVEQFVDIWNLNSVNKLRLSDFNIVKDGKAPSSYDAWVFNRGLEDTDVSMSGLYSTLINNANEYILMFPYLPLLSKNMKTALRVANERGVESYFIIPMDLRGYAKTGLSHELVYLIEETGVNVYLTVVDKQTNEVMPILHEKMTVVDGKYVVIGSSNFNFRSMELSNEIAMVIESKELADLMIEHAKEIIKESAFGLSLEDARKLEKDDGSLLAYLFMYYGG